MVQILGVRVLVTVSLRGCGYKIATNVSSDADNFLQLKHGARRPVQSRRLRFIFRCGKSLQPPMTPTARPAFKGDSAKVHTVLLSSSLAWHSSGRDFDG